MANDPKYSTYAFGQQNWQPGAFVPITEGTPASSVFYTTTVPTSATTTTPVNYTQYLYPQSLQEQLEAQLRAQHQAAQQWAHYQDLMRHAMLYGTATWHVPVEEPKALETRQLSAADRDELKGALPF